MLYVKRTFSYEYPLREADIALIGIPFDSTEIGVSVRHGPVFIREAIKNMPGYDPELRINIFDRLKFCDLGDVEVVPGDWNLTSERIRDTVEWIFKENPKIFPVFLGGEHLISLGVLEALKNILGKIIVVHLDAHRDLLPEYMGQKFSHITWAYHLAKEGFELVQMGCRSWEPEEEEVLRKFGVKETLNRLKGKIYLTVDLDVFDPGYAPEVGTPEPQGITPKEFFEILKQIPMKN
ncbi:MAG: hypothetical protein DRP15_02785, partial [Candidatus Aenigmatarchaeota archaeon]